MPEKNSLWQIQKEMQRNCGAYEKSDERAKEKQKSEPEPAWKGKMMDDFMKGAKR